MVWGAGPHLPTQEYIECPLPRMEATLQHMVEGRRNW